MRTSSTVPLKLNTGKSCALADVDVCGGVLLRRGDRALQHAVVELAVEVDVQCLRDRVVDAGDIIPGVGLQRRRPVAEHVPAGAVGQLEADPARAGVDRGVELEADSPSRLETMAASSPGNALELIQALIVMLPVICSAVGLPRLTKSLTPSSRTPLPFLPAANTGPLVSVPVRPWPVASAVVGPDVSLKA